MKRKLLLHKLFIALPILIFMAVYMVWFGAVERTDFSQCTEIHCALDDKIPFCEYFIVPYLLWFLLWRQGRCTSFLLMKRSSVSCVRC